MIDVFRRHQAEENLKEVGNTHLVLVEEISKRDPNKWMGKTDTFKKAFFENRQLPRWKSLSQGLTGGVDSPPETILPGEYVVVKVN